MSRLSLIVKRYLHDRKNYKFFIRNYIALGELQRAADAMNTLRHSQILRAEERPAPAGARITIVAPHPDDEIMGPGGTLVLALAQGCDVNVVYLTPGSSRVPDASPQRESEANARALGYTTRFLNLPVSGISVDDGVQRAFGEAISAHKPDLLWLPFLMDDEDDHRRASHLLWQTVQNGYVTGQPRVWAYQVYTSLPANVIVDITSAADTKAAAIERYVSQRVVRDWAHYVLGLNAANSRFLTGNAPRRYAEAFFELPLPDYAELCAQYFRPPAASCYVKPFYRGETA